MHSTHCVKSVQIRSFSWSVFSCIRTEYRKIRTRKNSVFEYFSCSDKITKLLETPQKFIDIYNIIIDLSTRHGILPVRNSERNSMLFSVEA